MKVTIKDVAKAAGVSITTVSRIINKVEGFTNEETKNRVLKVIKELNYKPNSLARSLVTKRTNTIGLILPDITNPFFPTIAKSIEKRLNLRGYSLILCNSYDDKENEENYLRILRDKCVDGIIASSAYIDDHNEVIEDYNLPIVFIDRKCNEDIKYGVFAENIKGAYLATEHLIKLGHRRIGCVIGENGINTTAERLDGYIQALQDNNISVDEDIIKSSQYSISGGYEAGKELLEKSDITAIFAQDDLIACGVYKVAKEKKIRIPKDLSVVGFDDIDMVELLEPPLTTIRQNTKDMGNLAVDMLMKLLDNKELESNIVTIPTNLVLRKSTKKLVSIKDL